MNKTIGVLAHVDAGKTTFSEQLLYHTNSIRARGRVDYKNTFLDNNFIEKERGITIFSEVGIFNYNNSSYYLIDTPGHIDFSTEMERAIQVMDYAILIVSAVEGIQGHTETIWRLLRENKIPTFIFINKVERIGVNIKEILKELKNNFSKQVFFMQENFNDKIMSDKLKEFIAENDDLLLEKYLNNEYDGEIWLKSCCNLIKNEKMFPCFSGSALQDIGILEFLKIFDKLTFTDCSAKGNFLGKVYKIKYDSKGNRITYIKAINGSLKVKDEIFYYNKDEQIFEKINEIRLYNGDRFKSLESIESGMVFAVTGLSKTKAGVILGGIDDNYNLKLVPTMKSRVIFDEGLNYKEILNHFKILEDEDPMLNVQWIEESRELQVHIMGTIQVEILKEIVKERFNIEVNFGPCEIIYKETIKEKSYGCAHFEPLKHYAEAHFKLEPTEKGKGIVFESSCNVDKLAMSYQNLIKSHIFEKEHKGILTGASLTDLKITLVDGKAHNKHTSGGDFREVTFRALRQGLEKVENILLEPYYDFKIEANIEYIGRIISDIEKLKGEFKEPEILDNRVKIKGRGPVGTFINYSMDLGTFTEGKGNISLVFSGYDICHNSEKVINEKNYNKDEDREYTSNSIFCSKGKSYVVQGKEADNFMHCFKK